MSLLNERAEKASELEARSIRIAQQEHAIQVRDETIARLENTVAKLQRWRFGRRSEHL
ncbi:IS66 family transposase, partial [Acidithiobacillus sp. VAN18-1]|nr:IS66 family transposase [Igneacidithiobacillus copahuensis]